MIGATTTAVSDRRQPCRRALQIVDRVGHLLRRPAIGEEQGCEGEEEDGEGYLEEEAKAQIEGIGTDYGESELFAFSGEEPEHEKIADVLPREGQ